MKVNFSLEPVQFLVGPEQIIGHLVQQQLIENPTHVTNSAWAG